MIAGILPLLLLGGLAFGVLALARRADPTDTGSGLRQLVTSAFTLVTATIAATGVAQLLGLVLRTEEVIAGRSSQEVAQAVALAAVGLPAFAVLWRYLRATTDRTGGTSLVWGLHLAGATAIFGIGTVVGLGTGLAWLAGWHDTGAGSLGTGLAFGATWAWHEWHRRSVDPPRELAELAPSIGSTIGLVTVATGGVLVLTTLLDRAYETSFGTTLVGGGSFGSAVGRSATWFVVGAAVWWTQWLQDARRRGPSLARALHLLAPGAAGGAIAATVGSGLALFLVLQHLFGDGETTAALQFQRSPAMLATVAVGFLVWRYHRAVVLEQPDVLRTELGYAYRYLVGGIGLVAAASGFGVVVNGLLAAATPEVAGEGGTDLLLGGLSAFVVGLPVWWRTWRPRQVVASHEATARSRRIYLTALAGIGGVTALVSLIVLLTRVVEAVLESDTLGTSIDRVRAPFGVLVATALVASYHVAAWRRERSQAPEGPPRPAVRRVTLLTSHPDVVLRDALRRELDVRVDLRHAVGPSTVVASHHLADHLRALDADEAYVVETDGGHRVIAVTTALRLPSSAPAPDITGDVATDLTEDGAPTPLSSAGHGT